MAVLLLSIIISTLTIGLWTGVEYLFSSVELSKYLGPENEDNVI